ncbi:CAF17-like 4Fe-4S cluster assembly/insertion protein YgfZ [Aeoliella sp. SH292]|uniref:CAF17-like 4Fe-4S cluster assembly/insertion protein YgfZ n=1 Tax=Aeoliella sp. SH292 TaxID=3454464 RepID=UPI003F9A1533
MNTSNVGIYFNDWPASVLVVTGGDRAKFLHNLCTADVLKMTPGESREAFFTNVKGHVLYHALVHAKEDKIVVIVFTGDAAPLAALLDRYLIREDVKITQGEAHPTLVVGSEKSDGSIPVPMHPAASIFLGEASVKSLEPGDRVKFDTLRVGAGWPLGGVDFGDGTLPQELSRDRHAISFNKGCYLGQETVARLDALGHVNKQMVRLRAVEGTTLAVGDELFDGEKLVGKLTTCTASGEAGLAMVRRGSNTAGTELRTAKGTATVEAID